MKYINKKYFLSIILLYVFTSAMYAINPSNNKQDIARDSIIVNMTNNYKYCNSYHDKIKIVIIGYASLGKKPIDTLFNATYYTRFQRPNHFQYKLRKDTRYSEGIPQLQQKWNYAQGLFEILPNLILSKLNNKEWDNILYDKIEKVHNFKCYKVIDYRDQWLLQDAWIDCKNKLLLKYRIRRLACDASCEMIIEYYPTKYDKKC